MSQLTVIPKDDDLTQTEPGGLGQLANEAAQGHVFSDYQQRRAKQTLRRQRADLALFARFLAEAGAAPGDLYNDASAWAGVSWGLCKAFVAWQLKQGYAIGSVNVRLSTVKRYAKLAAQAGQLDPTQFALIAAVEGYRRKENRHIDQARIEAGIPTRTGHKKAAPILLSQKQARILKRKHADDSQGRRDRLLMCLMVDHGLRVGEVAALGIQHIHLDYKPAAMQFFRSKVDKHQTHRLTRDSLKAARAWLELDADALGPLLKGSRRGGSLTTAGMSTQAITARVRHLGLTLLGIEGLSAHDLRHTWATIAARNGTPIDRLMEAGGWASPAMPLHYVETARIANEGVRLG